MSKIGSSASRVALLLFSLSWIWIGWDLGQEFFEPHNADLDHEIYYGQRVLFGELPWTREFYNKLPASQLLQAISALLGGIQAWRAISIIGVLVAAMIVYRKLPQLFLRYLNTELQESKQLAAYTVTSYFLLMSFIPGGYTTINALPASIFIAAVVVTYSRLISFSSEGGKRLLWAPGLWLAIAITIRPYFIGPFLALIIWLALESHSGRGRVPAKNHSSFQIFLFTGLWGFAANVTPYVLTGDIQTFIDGIVALTDGARTEFTSKAMLFLATTFVMSLAGTAWLLARNGVGFPSQVFGSSVFLVLVIFSQHFWSHYVAFFAWFASIGFWVVTAMLIPKFRHRRPAASPSARLLQISALATTAFVLSAAYGGFVREDFKDRRHDYVVIVEALYREVGPENVSFLAPRDMYSHWYFSESRRGLPGGAATKSIRDGFWAEKRQFESFDRPRSLDDFCAIIQESGVRFALVVHDYLPRSCFRTSEGRPWTLFDSSTVRDWPTDIWILENPDWDRKGAQNWWGSFSTSAVGRGLMSEGE